MSEESSTARTQLDGFESLDFEGLASAYNTPFYVYDADSINARIASIRQMFQGLAKVYYAVKSNPNLAVLRAVCDIADGVDISSGGELEQAMLAGFSVRHMSFAGPAKGEAELKRSIELGLRCISVESIPEIHASAEIAGKLGLQAHLCLRVNPNRLNRAFGLKMGGRAVQFGIDEAMLDGALEAVRTHRQSLSFEGIHVYAGSQCFEPEAIIDTIRNTFGIASSVERKSGMHCRVVNVGGGFGVSHTETIREIELERLAQGLLPVLQEFHASAREEREVVIELGRWLTANAGIYISRVIGEKTSHGKTFYTLDGGLNHHLAAAGTFGAVFRNNYPVRNLSNPNAPLTRCSLAGPSCNPTDLLGVDVELPRLRTGDLVGVLKSGSYSFTASPLLFLGRPTPAELVLSGGQIILGRRKFTILDFN